MKRGVTHTINGKPVDINFLGLVGEIEGPVAAVVDVHNAPFSVEPGTVFAPIASAAAVVHVQNGKASAGPVLNRKVKGGGAGRSRAAVNLDQEGWVLAV